MTPWSRSRSTLFPRFLRDSYAIKDIGRHLGNHASLPHPLNFFKTISFSYRNQRVQIITVTVNFLQVGISIYLCGSFRSRTYLLILLSFDLSNLKSIGAISKPNDNNSLGKTRSTINNVRKCRTVVDAHWKGARKRSKFAISRLSFEWTAEKAGEINRVRFG